MGHDSTSTLGKLCTHIIGRPPTSDRDNRSSGVSDVDRLSLVASVERKSTEHPLCFFVSENKEPSQELCPGHYHPPTAVGADCGVG